MTARPEALLAGAATLDDDVEALREHGRPEQTGEPGTSGGAHEPGGRDCHAVRPGPAGQGLDGDDAVVPGEGPEGDDGLQGDPDATRAQRRPQLLDERVGGGVPAVAGRGCHREQLGRRQRGRRHRAPQQRLRGLADVVRERHGHGRRQRQHVLPGLQRLGEQGGEATADHEAGLGIDALEEHAEPAVPEPRDDVPGRQPGAGPASERVECGLRGAAADGRRQLVEALQGDDEQAHPAADHA